MKRIILIIAIAVIILGGGAWFFLSNRGTTSSSSTTATSAPFGVAPTSPTNTNGGTPAVQTTNPFANGSTGSNTPLPNLFQVASDPVANAVVISNQGHEVVRYVDRATGHIFDADLSTLSRTQIVNTTAPKIYDAIWKPDGSAVVLRTVPDGSDTTSNTSLALTAPKSTTTPEYTIKASQLRGNVSAITRGLGGLVYVLKDTGTIGSSGFAGERPTTLYSSNFTDWQISAGGSAVTVTTNAASNVDGYTYRIDNNQLTKLVGPLQALASLISTDGSRLLYSYNDAGKFSLASLNIKTRVSTPIFPATFVEKCTWSLKNKNIVYCGAPGDIARGEPDEWYQGATHYSDLIWQFDADSGVSTLIAEPKRVYNLDLDIINPTLSPNEDYLIFMNKTDLSLWALKLK